MRKKNGFRGGDGEWPLTSNKATKQRGRRGYADSDLWNANTYIAILLSEMLEASKDTGYPFGETQESWNARIEKARKAWQDYIDGEYAIGADNLQAVAEEALDALKPIFLGLWN